MKKRIAVDEEIYQEFNKVSNCKNVDSLMQDYIHMIKKSTELWFDFCKYQDDVGLLNDEFVYGVLKNHNLANRSYVMRINPLNSKKEKEIFISLGLNLFDYLSLYRG
jgi:hypothetical protein